MAARLVRKISRAVLNSVAALDLRLFACGGGLAEHKQLMKKLVDDKRAQYFCMALAKGQPACNCRNGIKKKKKKKKKKVPKGYLPVLIVGNVDDEDEEECGDVSGGSRCLYRQVYWIRVCVLEHPLLEDLLNRSVQEFGHSTYDGALRLPCDAHTFEKLITLIIKSFHIKF